MSLLLVRRSYASVLLFTGLGLAGAGGFLVTLGGSSYYALAGVGLLASGALIWRGDARGARLYGALLVATVGWALWETGVAGWPLLPRLVAPIVLGLPLLAHGMRGTDSAPARFSGWPAFAIALLIAAAVGVGLHALGPKDVDPLYQRGVVTLAPKGPRASGPASGDLTETLVIFAHAERPWRGWVSRIRATSGNVHAMFYDNRPTGLAKP